MQTTSANEFDNLLRSTKRPGVDNLIDWLHSTDFYTAPASTRFHGCESKGLLYHSLAVYDCAVSVSLSIASIVDKPITEEELKISALLHDICKADVYEEYMKNVKRTNDDGTYEWVQEPAYKFNEKFCYGGHGSKSVYLAQRYIELTPEEATAINCHMGFVNADNISAISSAYEKCPLAWVIHVADEMATFMCKL